jgi:hypothetical protein
LPPRKIFVDIIPPPFIRIVAKEKDDDLMLKLLNQVWRLEIRA